MAAPDALKPKQPPSEAKKNYLVAYNFISSSAWTIVFARTLIAVANRGPEAVHPVAGDFTRWTQTMAGLEVLHSLFGIVRAPLMTTLLQVASRFILVWGVVYPFPFLAQSPWYTSMLFAWSLTEVIRYSFFAFTLGGTQSDTLTWLRYNTFYVLYPIGISSECILLWMATEPAASTYGEHWKWVLYAILAVYVPGSYILYTYMMKQREKVMRELKANDKKQ